MISAVYKMPVNGAWQVVTEDELCAMYRAGGAQREWCELWRRHYHIFEGNRLAQYLPHCDGKDFINDRKNTLCVLRKGNQQGGSSHGAAWILFRCLRTEPSWMCFTKHGIQHQEWLGPNKRILVATSDWGTMADSIWPEYLKLLPRYELGQYAPNYGDPELWPEEASTGLHGKILTFGNHQTKSMNLQYSRCTLFMSVYSQAQAAYESRQYDWAHLDEQIKEHQFIGLNERGRTRDCFQICVTQTAHRIKGRTDTGKNSWFDRGVWNGENTYGHKVGKYRLWLDGVPDELYSKEQKAAAYRQHVEYPAAHDDPISKRIGQSRLTGDAEASGGLALDNFDDELHLIPRFAVPADWTRYRAVDHGTSRPAACLLAAVAPWGDMVVYAEYKKIMASVAYHCKNIVALCGNETRKIDTFEDEISGGVWPIFEEVTTGTTFFASVLDGRSFNCKAPERGIGLGQLYNDCGLMVTPACTEHNETMLPMMKRWFDYDPEKPHIMVKLRELELIPADVYARWLAARKGQTKGGSGIYIFNDLEMLLREISTWMMSEANPDRPDRNCEDHLVGACLKYIVGCQPVYFGDNWDGEHADDGPRDERRGNKYVGRE